MRVANKCVVALQDILVVVYGPQAQDSQLQMRPSRVIQNELPSMSTFFFDVDLSSACLKDMGFGVMISYKLDQAKKKIQFKVPLSLVHLIKP